MSHLSRAKLLNVSKTCLKKPSLFIGKGYLLNFIIIQILFFYTCDLCVQYAIRWSHCPWICTSVHGEDVQHSTPGTERYWTARLLHTQGTHMTYKIILLNITWQCQNYDLWKSLGESYYHWLRYQDRWKSPSSSIHHLTQKLSSLCYAFRILSKISPMELLKSCIILHYNMYYFHFTLQEPC